MRKYPAVCALLLSGFAMTGAQETAIESEVRKVSAAMTAHATAATLINQDKKVIPLTVQNMEFGSLLQLHPLSNGMKRLKFALQPKTDYALAVCANTASLYHTDQKNSPLDDHAHF